MAKNRFDRIVRDNAAWALEETRKHLDRKFGHWRLLPTNLTGTYHNEVDLLAEMTDPEGGRFLIHIEFQTRFDANMLKRMARYHGTLYYKYKLPIYHFVFYLDRKEWTGKTDLEPKEVFTGFRLISLNQLPLERFLEAEDPGKLIFGILSNFGAITDDEGIQMLIRDLHRKSVNAIEYRKHLEELKILAEIGSLRVPLEKIVEDMPIEVDTTQFSEYKLGYSRGREAGIKEARRQERIKVILKLIADREITFAKAREILAVSEAQLRSYISGEA